MGGYCLNSVKLTIEANSYFEVLGEKATHKKTN